MPIWIPIVTAVIALAGFILSIVNWARLRPAVFIVKPDNVQAFVDGGLVRLHYTFEIHNAGASGISISAMGVVKPHEPLLHHKLSTQNLMPPLDKDCPLTLGPYSTEVVVLDAKAYVLTSPRNDYSDLEFVAEWYGRASIWRMFKMERPFKNFRTMKWTTTSIDYRRRRRAMVKVNLTDVDNYLRKAENAQNNRP